MFWRRERRRTSDHGASAAPGGDDDLASLQRQFGIKTVSDKDVEAELQKLLGGGGGGGGGAGLGGLGLSPRSELALLGHAEDGDSDEEAKILRELNISGSVEGVDLEALSDGGSDAESEVSQVLVPRSNARQQQKLQRPHQAPSQVPLSSISAAATAKATATPTPTPAAAAVSERLHAMKLEAVALKRAGRVPEALAILREIRALEAQSQSTTPATASPARARASSVSTSPHDAVVAQGPEIPDDEDIEVTDEDMENPEYLAELTRLGLHPDPTPSQDTTNADSIREQIRQTKVNAVELKRANRISEALTEMRKLPELEAQLAALTAAPCAPAAAATTHPIPSIARTGLPASSADVDGTESDVEVTEEDMNDPAFADELQRLGFGSTPPPDTARASVVEAVGQTASWAMRVSVVAQSATSIDDHDLIDEFEDQSDNDCSPDGAVPLVDNVTMTLMEKSTVADDDVCRKVDTIGTSGTSVDDLQSQLSKAKMSAIHLKREGNIQAALDMMRRVKQIDSLIEMKKQQESTLQTVSSPESERLAKFKELEELLVRFTNSAMIQAKAYLSDDRAKATEWVETRKAYTAELHKLREMRQVPGQSAPSFSVRTVSEQVLMEDRSVAEDEICVTVEAVSNLKQAAGRDIQVKFNLSFPSAAPHEGKTGVHRVSHAPPYETGALNEDNTFCFKVQRSRGMQRLFEIKKAIFEVWRPGTLLRNPEFIARGYFELAPLLSSTCVSSRVAFVGPNRKPVGGNAKVTMKLRNPLRDQEYQTVSTERLHIDPYPAPQASSDVQTLSPIATPTAVLGFHPARQDIKPENENEIEDPQDLELLVSYDVINDEITRIESKLNTFTGSAAIEWRDRLDSLNLKKQLLEIEMQTGKLTLDLYIQRLKTRISADRELASRLMQGNRRQDAARVFYRVRMMEKELEGANENNDGEEA